MVLGLLVILELALIAVGIVSIFKYDMVALSIGSLLLATCIAFVIDGMVKAMR